MSAVKNTHHIMIVGGGAGGAELARKLGRKFGKNKKAIITLVDNCLVHLWKPLLHEVAAGTLNACSEEIEFLEHARINHYQFRLGSMEGVDREKQEVLLAPTYNEDGLELIPARRFHYDTLIISVGSQTNHFNISGVKEHCLFLDSLKQATKFNQILMSKMIRAQTRLSPLREGQLHVAIAGAGATGIELAAELHGVTQRMIAYGFNNIKASRDIKITIIEASDKVLAALPEHLSQLVLKELANLNIDVLTNERVIEASATGFTTESGKFIPAETTVWAAGIKAPSFLSEIEGLESNNINQLLVKQTLETTNDSNIFAFGDCASCPMDEDSTTFVPPRAQAAHQQASLLVKTMKHRLTGKVIPTYHYVDYGSLVNLGKYSTVGNLMGNLSSRWSGNMRVEGFLARFVYKSLYKMHLVSLHGYTREILLSLASWLSNRGLKPRLKLH
ncbi:MAG: NAD(P)/FAD-dependent oxidoreductase [Cocleimonas sp.]